MLEPTMLAPPMASKRSNLDKGEGSSSSVRDADERRREQTRMAQRRYRMRKRQETDAERDRLDEDTTPRWFAPDPAAFLDARNHPPVSLSDAVASGVLNNTQIFTTSESMWAAYQMVDWIASAKSSPQGQGTSETASQTALRDLIQSSSQGGRATLTTPHLDFFRAYFGNAVALSFPPVDISKCKAPSRIKQIWHERTQKSRRVPENMHPVDEQLTVVHSVALDILPWPAVRSRVLRAIKAKLLDHDTFKIDTMFGTDAERIVVSPFRIHNAPTDDAFRFDDDASFEATMDPDNWECSKTWLEKYWFLVDESIVQRTNYWREKQGMTPVSTFGNPV